MQFLASLVTLLPVAEDAMEFTFDITDSGFQYQPGQYVTLTILSLLDRPAPIRSHDFSIVSSPHNPDMLQIVVRRSDSPFKNALFALAPGDTVLLTGPKGIMVLPETAQEPVIGIAVGIGITPFLSMMRYVSAGNSNHHITIYHCVSSSRSRLYWEELERMASQNPTMAVRPLYGRLRLERALPAIISEAESHSLWYLAGSPKSVTSLRRLLRESDIIDNRIRWEGFTGYGRRLY